MKTIRFIFLLLVASAFTLPPKPAALEYKFNVGDTYDVVQTLKQTIKQDIPGMGETTTESSTDRTLSLKVVSKTDNGAKIELSVVRVKNTTASPMTGNIVMDSDGAQDNMPNKVMKAMTTSPITFTVTKSGKIENVEGAAKFVEQLKSAGLEEGSLAGAKQILEQSGSDKTFKALIEQLFLNYAEAKINVGDTWKSSSDAGGIFGVRVDNTWTLSKLEGGVASIDADGTYTTLDPEKVFSVNMFKAKADMGGRVAVKGKSNSATGWPTEVKLLSEMKGKMTLLAGGQIPSDMDIPMEVVSEGTFTVTKK